MPSDCREFVHNSHFPVPCVAAARRLSESFAMSLTQVEALSTKFPQPKRLSLSEFIADSVAEAIATGHLSPGERIIETVLAERFDVSRVPIREALKVLHAQGILTGASHRGFRVAEMGPDTIERVLELRLMLETFLLRDAIGQWRSGAADPADLLEPIQSMEMAARSGDRSASLRADVEFHRTICRASGNLIASRLWEAIARHVIIIFSLELYRDNDLAAIASQHRDFHDYILSCIKAPRDIATYRRALEDHLLLVARTRRQSVSSPVRGK
jgi:DNA-binding GntR family transcriptional regulator